MFIKNNFLDQSSFLKIQGTGVVFFEILKNTDENTKESKTSQINTNHKEQIDENSKASHKPLSLSGWDRLIRQAFTTQILYNNNNDKYEKKK